jgi:hypothetical protein
MRSPVRSNGKTVIHPYGVPKRREPFAIALIVNSPLQQERLQLLAGASSRSIACRRFALARTCRSGNPAWLVNVVDGFHHERTVREE